jgi:hypothetical protein
MQIAALFYSVLVFAFYEECKMLLESFTGYSGHFCLETCPRESGISVIYTGLMTASVA